MNHRNCKHRLIYSLQQAIAHQGSAVEHSPDDNTALMSYCYTRCTELLAVSHEHLIERLVCDT